MAALHFGDSERPLFAHYHPAEARGGARPAALLCGPVGEEGVRAHRMLRVLAERLARSGSPAFRFDYAGTGDSAGDCDEVSLSSMTADVLAAQEELMDMTRAQRAVWIGVRLGASVALRAAQRTPRPPAGIVLWDPAIGGQDYLAGLAAAHKGMALPPRPTELAGDLDGVPREALGFALGEEFRDELLAMSVGDLKRKPTRRALIVASAATPEIAALQSALERLEVAVDQRYDADEAGWNSDEAINAYHVPAKTIAAIVEAVENWR